METDIPSLTAPETLRALGFSLLCITSLALPAIYGAYRHWLETGAKGSILDARRRYGETKNRKDLRLDDPLRTELDKYGPMNDMLREMMAENITNTKEGETRD